MGRAGRRGSASASAEDYHCHLYFSIDHLIYLYKHIMNPDDECDNETYWYQEICDFHDVIRILANPFECHKQLIEILLGNPNNDAPREAFPLCGLCSVFCCDVEMWPSLCMEGVQLVLSDVFNNVQGLRTMDNVRDAIKIYPNANRHLCGVNSNAQPKPININKMLFLLIADDIIDLNYQHKTDESPSEVTLLLSKLQSSRPGLRLMDEGYWTAILTMNTCSHSVEQ